jgi:hypothetical protein
MEASMPDFEIVPLNEAQSRAALVGRRGALIQEYVGYIQQLGQKQAGKLQATGDEKIMTFRRRLAQAAQALDMNLVIKRSGEELYFWPQPQAEERPRRGRRRQSQSKDEESVRETYSTETQQQNVE